MTLSWLVITHLRNKESDSMKLMFHSSNKLTELGRIYCSWPELMAVSIVVAESSLSCAWKLWGKTDSTKTKTYLLLGTEIMWSKDICLWAGIAYRQEMRSQLIGSLGQDTQAAAERACLQLSSAHLNGGSPLREGFSFPNCWSSNSLIKWAKWGPSYMQWLV